MKFPRSLISPKLQQHHISIRRLRPNHPKMTYLLPLSFPHKSHKIIRSHITRNRQYSKNILLLSCPWFAPYGRDLFVLGAGDIAVEMDYAVGKVWGRCLFGGGFELDESAAGRVGGSWWDGFTG